MARAQIRDVVNAGGHVAAFFWRSWKSLSASTDMIRLWLDKSMPPRDRVVWVMKKTLEARAAI